VLTASVARMKPRWSILCEDPGTIAERDANGFSQLVLSSAGAGKNAPFK
jgi:hypothetical protein